MSSRRVPNSTCSVTRNRSGLSRSASFSRSFRLAHFSGSRRKDGFRLRQVDRHSLWLIRSKPIWCLTAELTMPITSRSKRPTRSTTPRMVCSYASAARLSRPGNTMNIGPRTDPELVSVGVRGVIAVGRERVGPSNLTAPRFPRLSTNQPNRIKISEELTILRCRRS